MKLVTWTLQSAWTIRTISLTKNLITKYYISIKIQTTHSESLIKSPHQLRKEFQPYHPTKPYLTNQKKHQKALEKSGYWQTLKYYPSNENVSNNKRNRKRNVIWFNPPFSANVKTKVGNYFLILIRKHFPSCHKFSKLFNCNTIKVSYSCMPNIKGEIYKQKKSILEKAHQKNPGTKLCNCTSKK